MKKKAKAGAAMGDELARIGRENRIRVFGL
jgi:hypothetical protein